ncbi:signal recognition particle protein [Varunaivibrio sulfuroxidans]|uniref:Signal recognition particle protein n=1 Tax=Varunaivibrio sulfuroxidans TaxID=1773489 RepID=A0A4R3JD60_9PROT|nr:signal recognition particle protein [Varunaivibrio sulfuroxidans]TCS63624.1 signal recognition particle subunit FFH/SRP54 (srp54) [Varunaivibrio sulfuroxidans]WES30235.1 signal recognition particle protein [Varunaivibrio sulfuroxidans]
MFENLSSRLGDIFDGLKRRGVLKESDVTDAMRDVRLALLEADVALPVVKDFIAKVTESALGQDVLRSVTPGQMVVKIVNDQLAAMLGADDSALKLANPPAAILMLGLQGSGKTTTTAKIARRLTRRDKKKVLMASLDIYRPAAQQQLAHLGKQSEIVTLPIVLGERPLAIAKRAMDVARREGYDVVILDSAGRLHIDQELMDEVAAVAKATGPSEKLLVTDAMTGQDAVNVAREFDQKVGISGIVLTRVDGDARGGAALSMRAVSGRPIKLMGVGEKLDDLEEFDAQRIAGRILGMGDVVGLVEKAAEVIENEDAEKMAAKMLKGAFTLEDMSAQLGQLRKMGDMKGLLGMLPGVGKVKKQLDAANIDDKAIARQHAIIQSMTAVERRNPKVLNGSRRRRIAAGSGTSVQDVNRLLKQFMMMSKMMKKAGKMGKKGRLGSAMGPGGMMPPMH